MRRPLPTGKSLPPVDAVTLPALHAASTRSLFSVVRFWFAFRTQNEGKLLLNSSEQPSLFFGGGGGAAEPLSSTKWSFRSAASSAGSTFSQMALLCGE